MIDILSVYGKRVRKPLSLFLVLSILLFVQPLLCNAQENTSDTETSAEYEFDPVEHREEYSSVLYDNTNGLPTSEANAIAETSEGFLWIGSYSGLIRYDGNTFERIDSTTGIANVVSLFVDSKDRLWIGTNYNGIAVMEKGEFRMYNKSDGLKSSSVRSIAESENGDIYVATTHGICVIGEDMALSTIDEPQINEEYIVQLKKSADDTIYGCTKEGSVFTLKNRKLNGYYDGQKMGIDGIRCIFPDPEKSDTVYIGTKNSKVYCGNLRNGMKSPEITDVSPLEYVNSVNIVNDRMWVCSDNGIGIIKDGKFMLLDNVRMNNSIETVISDYQGNFWFTSSKQGIMKIVQNQFTDISERYGLDPSVINVTCMYRGRLFIGTKNDGLTVLDSNGKVNSIPIKSAVTASGKKLDIDDLIKFLEGSRIRSIVCDSKERLWFSVFGDASLIRYYDGNIVQFSEADGLPSDRVRTVAERSDGSIMVASTGGLSVISDDKVTEVYNNDSGISNTEVLTVTEGFNGEMIIGTDGDGIYVIDNKKITHFGTDEGLNSEVVMRIKKDNERNIFWIITSNSLAYMTSDFKITTVTNFPYSNNFDMYENSRKEMWVLSSNGIYCVPTEQLIENGEIDAVFYGMDNGLPCIATANSYSQLMENGDLYIAGTTGIAKMNIEKPFENVSKVAMSVPYLEIDGEFIYPDSSGKFTLPSDVNKITVYGFVYNYSLVNPQITYYLDGFDKHKTTVRRSELVPIDYTNLKGGEYRFVMLIKDSHGIESKEISVLISKKKTFFETPWFYTVCIILLALIVLQSSRYYVKRKTQTLMEKEQQNRLLVREIVEAFARVIDMKDKYTRGHSFRVAEYTAMLTQELGYDDETVEKYYNIALLHDIGKIGVPEEILNKAGRLTDEEYKIIKSHSGLGYNALKDISIMPELAIGAVAHHERPDGKGYPKGLAGDEIPRVAQIIAVADTFDAMYSDRPYRKRMNFEKVVSIMEEVSGTQLTSDVVDAFIRLVNKGKFRASDDNGGGTTENIDNIHEKFGMNKNGKK